MNNDNVLPQLSEEEAAFITALDELVLNYLSNYGWFLSEDGLEQALAKVRMLAFREELGEAKITKENEEEQILNWLKNISLDATSKQILDNITKIVDDDESEQLLNLKYKVFLRTNYWDWVRQAVLIKVGKRCQRCGRKGKLQVHHKTYEHRGKEHLFIDDLEVLCRNCHCLAHSE